jgi:hypothetical protein
MPGLFQRITNWLHLQALTDSDINNEFNNIIQNFIPQKMDDYSANVTQMQTQTSPGDLGSESLATSLAGELERIRYMLKSITGKAYWYQPPGRSLAIGGANIVYYLPFDGSEAADVYQKSIKRGVCTSAMVSSKVSSTQKKFGNFSYDCNTSSFVVPHLGADKDQNSINCHLYNFGANQGIMFAPQINAELFLNASGLLTAKITKRATSSESAKDTASITGSQISGTAAWKHVMMKWRLNGSNGSGADQLGLVLDGVTNGSQLSSQTIKTGISDGGPMIWNARRADPSWTKFSAMRVKPNLEASNPWTFTGAAGAVTIPEDGLLKIATDGSGNYGAWFSTTNSIDMSQLVMDFRFRVTDYLYTASAAASDFVDPAFKVKVRDDSMNRSFAIGFMPGYILLMNNVGTAATPVSYKKIAWNCTDWHHYRIVLSGSPSPVATLYIDGVSIASITVDGNDATAADTLSFGDHETTVVYAGHDVVCEMEHFAYGTGTTAPYTQGASGYIDDVGALAVWTDSATDLSFASSRLGDVLAADKVRHAWWYYNIEISPSITYATPSSGISGGTTPSELTEVATTFMSDGETPMTAIARSCYGIDNAAGDVTVFMEHGPNYSLPYYTSNAVLRKLYPSARLLNPAANAVHSFTLMQRKVFPVGPVGMKFYNQIANGAHTSAIYYDYWQFIVTCEGGG